MNPFGQIGQQMADTGIELIKDTASSTVKAAADITKGTAEQILTTSPDIKGAPQQGGDKSMEKGKSGTDPNIAAQRKAADRKQLQTVQEQLSQYIKFKKEREQRQAQEEAQKKQQTDRTEGEKKQKQKNWVMELLSKSKRGSHGESDKQKE